LSDIDANDKYDAYDLDSDADGCFDTIEAGFTDPDADGILGNSPVSINGDAVVTGQGGYTTPLDTSPSNGVFDFQESAIPFWVTATGALDESVECAIDAPVIEQPPCASSTLIFTFFNQGQNYFGFGLKNELSTTVDNWQLSITGANYQIDPTLLSNQSEFVYSEVDNGDGTYDLLFTGTTPLPGFGFTSTIETSPGFNLGFVPTSSAETILCGSNEYINTPVASDGCGPVTVTEISDVTTPGSCANSYTRVLTYQATNGIGNTSPLFTTTITVDDTTAPTASNLDPITVLCAAEIPSPDVLLITDEADNCTANPVVTFVNDVRTYRVTDECGNSTDVTQIITVTPIIITTQPANITANAGDNPTFAVVASNVDTYQWQVSTNGGTQVFQMFLMVWSILAAKQLR